ncbi:DNA primase [Micromonospora rubida]|uniref:DNA primase n=1 Tax=Micromonospora rubida TaxID=2697657 RepID=UPI0013779953|nr:DNA primase [Micromonospora rubida]NBE81325.1 DNA primase [Micromonospora rubida]
MGNPKHPEVSVARQSPQRPDADEPELDETNDTVEEDGTVEEVDEEIERPSARDADRSLWDEVRIDPVEIALPSGTGYTLRAYRPARELTPTDVADRDTDDPFLARRQAIEVDEDGDEDEVVILDEEVAAEFAEAEEEENGGKSRRRGSDDSSTKTDEDEADEATDAEDEDEDDEEGDEEVPVFLSHQGKLLLFKTPESLVSFVRSGAPNDMSQLDSWNELSDRLSPGDIVPLDEDTYELDLVVENLRGGHDTWDAPLLIEAGEAARDVAYALRLPAVLDMLSSGSSLDDLDEALRSTVNGGIGGFLGRRRLKKIGAQTASLGWRTIVGKISAVVDWRD